MKRADICAGAALTLAVLLAWCTPQARADSDGVKKYLDEAREHVKGEDWDDAKQSLELAGVELNDVPAGEKETLANALDAVRKDVTTGENAEKRQALLRRMKLIMTDAKDRAKDKRRFDEKKAEFDEQVKSEEWDLLTDKEKADYTKEMGTYAKLAAMSGAAEALKDAERQAKEVEEKAPGVMEQLKASPESIPTQRNAEELQGELAELKKMLDALPADDAKAKALRARHDAIAGPLVTAMRGAQVDEVYRRLKEYWDQGAAEFEGWKEETAEPTYEEYLAGGQDMDVLKSRKTAQMLNRADRWLDLDDNEAYQAVKDDPKIKALVDGIRADRDTARARVVKKIEKVVAGAEAAPKVNEEHSRRLGSLAGFTIGQLLEEGPGQKAFEDRTRKVIDRAGSMATAEADAVKQEAERVSKEAAEAWPKLVASIQAADGESMNPAEAKVGQLYRFKGRQNRGGAEYDWGQFDLIIPVNGVPIAAKYEPAVGEAIGAANSKFGHSARSFDDCIIEITGRANVQEREWVQVTNQWHSTFIHKNVPLGRVIAFHDGPIAVAVAPGGGGAVIGSAGAGSAAAGAAAAGGTSALGWAFRVLYLVAGLAAGTLLLVRAKHPALAGIAPAGQAQLQTVVGPNVGIIGIVFVLLGLWWLLSGLVYRDLLPAAALILAGVVLALDLLKSRGVVREPLAAKLAAIAAPIGVACALLAVLHLVVGGWPLV